ncbi:MAG TPA: hypothetical protein VFX85_02670 [Solirubrobacterales bacterium]|nr:hypothetical protein [Solirubrobacterales bacterium]
MRSLLFAMFAFSSLVLGLLAPQADAAVPAHGRGWELTSINPPSSSRVPGLWPISSDGNQFVIATVGPPRGTESGAAFGFATATRGPSGWTNTPIGIPYDAEFAEGINDVASALAPIFAIGFGEATLWWANVPLTPGAPPEGDLALYRQFPGQAPEFISKTGTGVTFFGQGFMDISSDGEWVVFTSSEHLLPGDAGRTEGESVYAWNGGGLELVDVDSGGNLLSTCGSRISKANGMAVASDRVFFTTSANCGNPKKVYLADLNTGDTTEISASLCTRLDCNAPADVSFSSATADGRFAYMTTTQQLVNGDEDESRDLYRYNTDTDQLSLLSGTVPAEFGEVLEELVYPSEGGERVYFRTLSYDPSESWENRKEAIFLFDGSGLKLVSEALISPPAEFQLSANGARALFVTQTQIAAGDTDQQGDVYLYDATTEDVTWVSTGPAGGNQELPARIEASAPLNRWEFQYGNTQTYRAMDAAGERVFFQTAESLVAEDTNSEPDVYELWNGDLGLVTPGNQPLRSDFAGVSRDGKTVVFGTNAALVGSDDDGESRDLYVARVGGGFPEPPPGGSGCDNVSCPIPLDGRLQTSSPPTLGRAQGKAKPAALRVIEVAPKAKKGAIAVVVSVPGPGKVSGQISTVKKGKKVTLATGSKSAKKAGNLELKLTLTGSARRSASGSLSGQLTLKQGSSQVSQTVKVSLP